MLPKAHLTLHFRMSSFRWVITPLRLSGHEDLFVQFFCVFCHLFLISSASVRSIPLLSFFCAHLCMKCSLSISKFLEEISHLSHSIFSLYFFALITEEGFLSLIAILWNSAFKWVYISFSSFPLLLFFSQLFVSFILLLCYDIYCDNFMFLLWIFANRCSLLS